METTSRRKNGGQRTRQRKDQENVATKSSQITIEGGTQHDHQGKRVNATPSQKSILEIEFSIEKSVLEIEEPERVFSRKKKRRRLSEPGCDAVTPSLLCAPHDFDGTVEERWYQEGSGESPDHEVVKETRSARRSSRRNLNSQMEATVIDTTKVANNASMVEPSPSPTRTQDKNNDADHLSQTPSGDQPMHNAAHPGARIYSWIAKSLGHPLSREANAAKVRPALQRVIEFAHANIEGTITQGFNNSVLIVGAPGSGKTKAVSRICNQAQEKWNTSPDDPRVGIVKLSGWAHSDERSAFREIARQLCESLHLQFSKTASFDENIQFFKAVLKGLKDANKAALFILEDFDMFARQQKQTFLYCLLDSLQKSDAKAVVIGTTSRYDCLDLLEKRVKSRFSHRTIVLSSPDCLSQENEGLMSQASTHSQRSPGTAPSLSQDQEDRAHSILQSMLTIPKEYIREVRGAKLFNTSAIQALQDPKVQAALRETLSISNNLHDLANIARWSISHAEFYNRESPGISKESLLYAFSQLKKSTVGMERSVARLSVLDLSVLIAASRVHRRQSEDFMNFEMIYHEFAAYTGSGEHVDNYSKVAAAKAFEHLIQHGFLAFPRERYGPLRRRDRFFCHVSLQVSRSEMQEGIQMHPMCPARMVQWFTYQDGPRTTALAM